jgi:hypothetical protein
MTETGPTDADYWTGYKAVSSWGGLDVFVRDAAGRYASTYIIVEDSGSISNCNT